jgi:hypothetical protein
VERGTAAEALITGKDISANHQLDAPTRRVKSSHASESQGDTMETAEVEYRGYVIKHPSSPKAESDCQVYVESENHHLLSRLLGQHLFEDQHGVERAIKKAKRYIEIILG